MSEGGEPASERSPAPFLAALAVFAIVLIGIAVLAFTGGDGLSEEQRVGRAAVGQNDALQRDSYADFTAYTCAAQRGDEAAVLGASQQARARDGARFIEDITDIVIEGDRARATVAYYFEGAADDRRSAPLSFVREDGAWKVCSAYPA